MQIHTMEVCCDICGGPGVATPRGAAAQWIQGNILRHTNPSVCASYLAQKKAELDKREKELEKQQ